MPVILVENDIDMAAACGAVAGGNPLDACTVASDRIGIARDKQQRQVSRC